MNFQRTGSVFVFYFIAKPNLVTDYYTNLQSIMLCLFCTCRNPGNRTSLQELETHCRLKPKCCVVTKKGLANRNLGGCLICFCLLMLHQRNNFQSLENRGRKCCNNVGICSEIISLIVGVGEFIELYC